MCVCMCMCFWMHVYRAVAIKKTSKKMILFLTEVTETRSTINEVNIAVQINK